MKMKLLSLAYHRNGICGNPFWCALFRDEDKTVKLAVLFNEDDTDCSIAVFDAAKIAQGDISFGSNSWRGDHYHAWMKKQIKEHGQAALLRGGQAMAKEAQRLIEEHMSRNPDKN